MKYIIAFLFILQVTIIASSAETTDEKKLRIEKQIKEEIEKEKKYAQEQKFYNNENYDFKRSEINKETLHLVPEIEVDDLDMNSVYD